MQKNMTCWPCLLFRASISPSIFLSHYISLEGFTREILNPICSAYNKIQIWYVTLQRLTVYQYCNLYSIIPFYVMYRKQKATDVFVDESFCFYSVSFFSYLSIKHRHAGPNLKTHFISAYQCSIIRQKQISVLHRQPPTHHAVLITATLIVILENCSHCVFCHS